jgi:hypothetical protein
MTFLQSGLDADSQFVIGETREEFAQLQYDWIHFHQPRNPEERYQVDKLIRNEWLGRRFFRAEAQLWEYESMNVQRRTGVELGEVLSKSSLVFNRLQRRIDITEKHREDARVAVDRLIAVRTAPAAMAPAPQPAKTTEKTRPCCPTPSACGRVRRSGAAAAAPSGYRFFPGWTRPVRLPVPAEPPAGVRHQSAGVRGASPCSAQTESPLAISP